MGCEVVRQIRPRGAVGSRIGRTSCKWSVGFGLVGLWEAVFDGPVASGPLISAFFAYVRPRGTDGLQVVRGNRPRRPSGGRIGRTS